MDLINVYLVILWKNGAALKKKFDHFLLLKKDARAFARFFFSGAVECEIDKQGRINLPKNLLNYAKIEKECMILGVSSRIEIWGKSVWDDYLAQSEDSFAEIAENLIDFDL